MVIGSHNGNFACACACLGYNELPLDNVMIVIGSCKGDTACSNLGFSGELRGNITNSCKLGLMCVQGGAEYVFGPYYCGFIQGDIENSCNAAIACNGAGQVYFTKRLLVEEESPPS